MGNLTPLTRMRIGSGERFSMRFVVGTLRLTDGLTIPYVVASVASIGSSPTFPEGALLFLVHTLSDDRENAIAQARRLTEVVSSNPRLELGPKTVNQLGQGDERLSDEVGLAIDFAVGDGCRANCNDAYDIKVQNCDSSYGTCIGSATVAYGLCNLACGPTLGAACVACAAAYYLALSVCNSNNDSCLSNANADRNACTANCPVGEEERVCPDDDPTGCTPIVINLDGREGFRFTSAAEGVSFDLNADQIPNLTAWTEPGYDQAFLVLDRNGNGMIDDGTELFGGMTEQPASDTPNGFLALAVLDSVVAGGNGDGRLDDEDAAFGAVRLWLDENHDGVSQTWELISLPEAGVQSIDTNYVIANRQDRHGNWLRYTASVRLEDRATRCVDVIFVQQAP